MDKKVSASISPEGYIELVYAENIDIYNQNEVLSLGLEKATEAGLGESGFDVLINATNTKSFMSPSGILANKVAGKLKFNHIAVYGPPQSLDIMKKMAIGFEVLTSLRKYFPTREEAVAWLNEVNKKTKNLTNLEKSASLSPEGFLELFYAENINLENQALVLKQGLEIANDANLLQTGLNIIIDASKTKSYDDVAGVLTKHASESVKINHIAIFGPRESQELLKKIGKIFGDKINNLIGYFETREDAVKWLKSFI